MKLPAIRELISDIRNPLYYPIDLKLAFLWSIITIISILIPFLRESILMLMVGLPFCLFIPGYLLVVTLFPSNGEIEWIERVALSFGLSIAIVPLMGVFLNYTPFGVRIIPILVFTFFFSIFMIGMAAYRRVKLSEENQLEIPIFQIINEIKKTFFPNDNSLFFRIIFIIQFIALVLIILTTICLIFLPHDGEHFTDFYILGENGKSADFPVHFWAGTNQTIIIGIGNHEDRNMSYEGKVFGFYQETVNKTNISIIYYSIPLGSFSIQIPDNETVEFPFTFIINDMKINRIEFLLYDHPTQKNGLNFTHSDKLYNSYRDLHLWVQVDESHPFFRKIERSIEDRRITDQGSIDLSGIWNVDVSGGWVGQIKIVQTGNKISGKIFSENIFGDISENNMSFTREGYDKKRPSEQYYKGTYMKDNSGKEIILGTMTEIKWRSSYGWKAEKIPGRVIFNPGITKIN
ncbi:DUF1616 domain-containing protein [Methanospirillum sp.]